MAVIIYHSISINLYLYKAKDFNQQISLVHQCFAFHNVKKNK